MAGLDVPLKSKADENGFDECTHCLSWGKRSSCRGSPLSLRLIIFTEAANSELSWTFWVLAKQRS
jgi:hypothetical protein